MSTSIWTDWHDAFLQTVQDHATAGPLKESSLAADLLAWTSHLTTAVVRSCEALGWPTAAKGHRLELLPQAGQEYLTIDVMAFPGQNEGSGPNQWPLPIAVFELENHQREERIAYSLWKVLCLQAPLRVVFAYRPDWQQGSELIVNLAAAIVKPMAPEQRMAIAGETVLVVGNRGEGETFPWGYFKAWRLDMNRGTFDKI